MCDSATQSVIEDVVTQKVTNSEMFTAFDVTVAVQNRLKTAGSFDPAQHRHRNLRNDVHSAVDRITTSLAQVGQNAYDRQLQDVGAPEQAYVYYRVGSDPANYVPMTRNDKPAIANDPFTIQITNAPAPVPVVGQVDPTNLANAASDSLALAQMQQTPVDNKTGNADARGTVCVSRILIENAGMKPGDTAVCYIGKDDLNRDAVVLVSRQNAAPYIANSVTSYTVDSHGNIRVTEAVFKQANLVSQTYDCCGNSTQVFIRPQ